MYMYMYVHCCYSLVLLTYCFYANYLKQAQISSYVGVLNYSGYQQINKYLGQRPLNSLNYAHSADTYLLSQMLQNWLVVPPSRSILMQLVGPELHYCEAVSEN